MLKKLSFCFLLPLQILAQWQLQNSQTNASFRSIYAVNDQIVWAGGSKGTVLFTNDGGQHWHNKSVKGAENLDFRGIWAFDALTAVAMSAGLAEDGQAKMYRTNDGGQSWNLVWQTNEKGAFLDGISFWDNNSGLAFGDPIDGHWYLLKTSDGGQTWQRLMPKTLPPLVKGEAAFAASNASMAMQGRKNVWIGSGGGQNARVFYSNNQGKTWQVSDTPLAANSSSGIFGVRFFDKTNGMAVGGDYRAETTDNENFITTTDGGKTWQKAPKITPMGLKESIIKIQNKLLAVGPAGSSISTDGGATWQTLDNHPKGVHALGCGTSKCFVIGAKGILAVYNF